MKKIRLYSKDWCPYCVRAKALLAHKGLDFEEINLESKEHEAEALFAQTGFRTVPQIFIGDQCIGGFSELAQLEQSGELDQLLEASS
jgi:glutaredoxin 3